MITFQKFNQNISHYIGKKVSPRANLKHEGSRLFKHLSVLPNWGNNHPFVLETGDECEITPALVYSGEKTSAFYNEGLEVYETSRTLTDEQRDIALFWADNPAETATPPGHWLSILNQVISEQGYSLDRAAEAYAKLGIAVADSFIGCWNAKYDYNVLRPITYIQNAIDQIGVVVQTKLLS